MCPVNGWGLAPHNLGGAGQKARALLPGTALCASQSAALVSARATHLGHFFSLVGFQEHLPPLLWMILEAFDMASTDKASHTEQFQWIQ